MKFILLLILSLIVSINANFLNIVPYEKSNCRGSPSGIGYSGILYSCFTFDYGSVYVFKNQNGQPTIETHMSMDGEMCDDENIVDSVSFKDGACVPYEQIGSLNFKIATMNKNKFFLVSISSKPFIPSNSIVNSYMPSKCYVSSSNAILYQYFTNGTILLDNPHIGEVKQQETNIQRSTTWSPTGSGTSGSSGSSSSVVNNYITLYCNKGVPTSFNNEYPVDITVECAITTPFFNSSYTPPSTMSIIASSSSSSGTASSSSSSSSSSSTGSGSGSGSGSTSGMNLQLENNNIKNQFGGENDYENVYCSN